LEIRLAALRMLVRAKPDRLDGRQPELAGAANVLVEPVADEDGVARLDAEHLERALEDRRVRLPHADLRREDGAVEAIADAHAVAVAVQEPGRVESVRDEPELQAGPPERVQGRMGRGSEPPGRLPGRVLRLEEAVEVALRDVDPEVAEAVAYEAGVLDLLQRTRHPQERLVAFAKVLGEGVGLGEPVAPDGDQARAVPRAEERLVVDELHERVAPVEQHRLEHPGRVLGPASSRPGQAPAAGRGGRFARPARPGRAPSAPSPNGPTLGGESAP